MADGEQKVEMENQIYAIPEQIMKGSGEEVRAHCYCRGQSRQKEE